MQQRLLPFSLQPNWSADSYMVTEANRYVFNTLMNYDAHREVGFFLHGPQGSGKTHLAHVWQVKEKAVQITCADLNSTFVEGLCHRPQSVIIEDLEQMPSLSQEKYIFNLYNIVKEAQKKLLITAPFSPERLHSALPDLKTRLATLLPLHLNQVDDELLMGIIHKRFSDATIPVDGRVLSYLSTRMERSYEAIERIMHLLCERLLAEKRVPTIPYLKEWWRSITGSA